MDLSTVYSDDLLRRVIFFANNDGTFGFREEFLDSELGLQFWLPALWPASRFDTLQTAYREALGRTNWLADVQPPQFD